MTCIRHDTISVTNKLNIEIPDRIRVVFQWLFYPTLRWKMTLIDGSLNFYGEGEINFPMIKYYISHIISLWYRIWTKLIHLCHSFYHYDWKKHQSSYVYVRILIYKVSSKIFLIQVVADLLDVVWGTILVPVRPLRIFRQENIIKLLNFHLIVGCSVPEVSDG